MEQFGGAGRGGGLVIHLFALRSMTMIISMAEVEFSDSIDCKRQVDQKLLRGLVIGPFTLRSVVKAVGPFL